MNSNLERISITDMSYEDWLRYRKTGIGASEVGIILGLSPYKSSIELFWEKIGQGLTAKPQSLAAFLGKTQEEYVSEMWEAWDGSEEGMMNNYTKGTKVRRCKRVNAYMRNPKYPWLFVSLDFEINQAAGRGNGALETKTIGEYSAAQWAAGFPPFYVTQLITQCGVCEFDFGESAILEGNRKFYVLPFEMDAQNSSIFTDTILPMTKAFWDKVIEARKLLGEQWENLRLAAIAEQAFDIKSAEALKKKADEAAGKIQLLEPGPDGSDSYHAFLKEKYQIAIPGELAGTAEDLNDAKAHLAAKSRLKEIEEAKQLPENKLKAKMGREECDRLDFGKSGYISWKANKNGVRVFKNDVKP